MINIPEKYQIIILVIVLLFIGYYALVLNKKVEGFGLFGVSDILNPVSNFITNNVLGPINDLISKIKDLPEQAKNKILGVLEKPISFVKNTIQQVRGFFEKVYRTLKSILEMFVGFIKKKLLPFFGDKLSVVKNIVMDKISPILEKTLDFVTGKLKKVWEIAINATGIPDMLQTGYYIALGFLICGIALNSYSIINVLFTPVKCYECNCTCN